MEKFMISLFGKSWRTAVTGYGAAAFFAVLPIIQTGAFNIHKDWPNLFGAIGCAIFGRVSKDAKATGLPDDKTTTNATN